MTIQDWGAIGEIVGAIGVVLSLVYLARQIRHQSDVSKVTSYHQAIEQIVKSAGEPDFPRLRMKIESGEALSPEERARADVLATMFLYSHEILLHLYRKGQVDEGLWQNIMENNLGYLTSDMMLPLLRARTGPISRDLLDLVEQRAGS